MSSSTYKLLPKTAIIIGATSGIGEALAEQLSQAGYTLGLTGRRVEKLNGLKSTSPSPVFIQQMDVSNFNEAEGAFHTLVKQIGHVDLVIINAGINHINKNLKKELEIETIGTNCSGFVTIATTAFNYFKANGGGHLVGMSSIAKHRGNPVGQAYSSSKAFVSNYLEGLHIKAFKEDLKINVTDIRPGFVDTAMAKGDGIFWCASPQKAAQQIIKAINKQNRYAYITKRRRLIGILLKILPFALYKRL